MQAAVPESTVPVALWIRVLSRLPFPAIYALASVIAWITSRLFPYRSKVVRENLALAFPDRDATAIRRLMNDYYAGYADVLFEIVKSARMTPAEIRARVVLKGLDAVRERLAAGRPVLLLAAHQCNWEWMLLALSLELGCPLDAAYKPLVDSWADRDMRLIRSRFGARLVPAPQLLGDILQRRKIARAIAMVGDQEPVQSDNKHWLRFLNRDSAFFTGGEEIARATRYPAFFMRMRRVRRGYYEMGFDLLWDPAEKLEPGQFTERYARCVEQQIHAAPSDWPWSHKRWKLKRSIYS